MKHAYRAEMVDLKDLLNKVHLIEVLEGLRQLPDESIDEIVSDPPYGLEFMGRDWDKVVPPVEVWKECLRVLKPGAFAMIMSSPRQDVFARMIVNLQDAGFDTGFTSLFWAYPTGFPKAMNVAKAVDKKLGVESEIMETKTYTRASDASFAWQDGNNRSVPFKAGEHTYNVTTPTSSQAQTLSGSYSFSPKPAVEIIIVAMKPLQRLWRSSFWERDKTDYFYTSKAVITKGNKEKLGEKYQTEFKEGDTIETRIAINPLLNDEIITNRERVIESQPYKDTELTSFVSQAMWNKKGIVWFDDCRIPVSGQEDYDTLVDNYKGGIERATEETKESWNLHEGGWKLGKGIEIPDETKGRFPANLLVSDDVLGVQSGGAFAPVKSGQKGFGGQIYGKYKTGGDDGASFHSGTESTTSFSRYFSLDAWHEKLMEHVNELPKDVQQTLPFFIVPKPSQSERNRGCEGLKKEVGHNRFDTCQVCGGYILQNPDRPSACKCEEPVRGNNTIEGNTHITVKSVALFQYLITLGSREGDIILDPYIGSGTCGMAAKELNRLFIGFDNDQEAVEIAQRRIGSIKGMQKTLFSE